MDDLIEALRRGEEAAFTALLARYQAPLVRLARTFVVDELTAEEVVQETWIAVLKGIDRFEARSSLKTWLYTILMNRAKTRARRDERYAATSLDDDADDTGMAQERFFPAGHEWEGGWREHPASWEGIPETRMISRETHDVIRRTMEMLPTMQRQVMLLRDVEGWEAPEVCNLLNISETNQRVLLHRARSKVRQALENYFKG